MLHSLLLQVILMSPKFFSQLLHFCWILSGAMGATSSRPRRTSMLNPHLARVDDVSKHYVPTKQVTSWHIKNTCIALNHWNNIRYVESAPSMSFSTTCIHNLRINRWGPPVIVWSVLTRHRLAICSLIQKNNAILHTKIHINRTYKHFKTLTTRYVAFWLHNTSVFAWSGPMCPLRYIWTSLGTTPVLASYMYIWQTL
jgi:hypothetical protein